MLMCQIYARKKDYLDSFEKSKEVLSSKDKFYDTNHANSDKNYEHFLNAWKAFKVNNMKKYYDLYLKVDYWLVCLKLLETNLYILFNQILAITGVQ